MSVSAEHAQRDDIEGGYVYTFVKDRHDIAIGYGAINYHPHSGDYGYCDW